MLTHGEFVFQDDFEDPLSSSNWSAIDASRQREFFISGSGGSSASGPIDPFGTWAVNLDGARTELRSKTLNLSSYDAAFVIYYVQAGGHDDPPESDNDLRVEYRASNGQWKLLRSHDAGFTSNDDLDRFANQLPSDALHSNFAFRFNASASDLIGGTAFDDWFVDSVGVFKQQRPSIGFTHDISSGGTSESSPVGRTDSATRRMGWSVSDPDGDVRDANLSVSATMYRKQGSSWVQIQSSTSRVSNFTIPTTDHVPGPKLGEYRLTVTATDSADFSRTSHRYLTLSDNDTTPPSIILGGSSGTQSNGATQFFTWNVSDASGIFSNSVVVRHNGTQIFSTGSHSSSALFGSSGFNFDQVVNQRGTGTYTITVTATDDDNSGLTRTGTREVLVTNVAPVADAGGPYIVDEGTQFVLDGSASSDGDEPNTKLDFEWDLDYDGSFNVNVAGETPAVTFPNDFATRTIALRVRDSLGTTRIDTTTLTVNNFTPTIAPLADRTALENETLTFTADVTEPGGDVLTYEWDLDDGTTLTGVDLASISHAYTEPGNYTVTLTVSDDDTSVTETFGVAVGPPVTFTTAALTVTEEPGGAGGGGRIVVEARMDAPLSRDVAVPLLLSGRAALDRDFTLSSQTLVIPAGAVSGTVFIDVIDDVLSEDAEDLVIRMGLPTGASHGAITQQTITIEDNDPLPTVSFTSSLQIVDEGAGTISLGARLIEPAGRDVILPLDFNGSSAVSPDDYSLPSGAVLVIPEGSLQASLAVDIIDDNLGEPAERIQIAMQPSAQAVLSTNAGDPLVHTVIIPQNDAPSVFFAAPVVNVPAAFRPVLESAGTVPVRIQLSNPTVDVVTVPFSIAGTAATSDFTIQQPGDGTVVMRDPHNGVVTIPAGTNGATILVALTNDAVGNEPNRSIEFRMDTSADDDPEQVSGASLGASQSYVLSVRDDDTVQATFTSSGATVWEDHGSVSYTVQLTNPSSVPVTVPLVISGTARLGSDVSVTTTPVIFQPGGPTSITRTISIVNDAANERSETFRIEMNRSLMQNAVPGDQTSYVLTIQDNDPLTSFGGRNRSVVEDDGSVSLPVRLSAATNRDVVIPLFYSGTARSGTDYAGPATVTIPAGATTATAGISLLNDSFNEGTESFTVRMGTPSGARLASGTTTRTVTIRDDDAPPTVSIDISRVQGSEKSRTRTTITAELNSPTTFDVVVPVSFAFSTATRGDDFTTDGLTNNRLVIPAGHREASFDIRVVDDTAIEDSEGVIVTLGNATNARTSSSNSTMFTILDNDEPATVPKGGFTFFGGAPPSASSSTVTTDPATGTFGTGSLAIDTNGVYQAVEVGPLDPALTIAGDLPQADTVPPGSVQLSTANGFITSGTVFFDANFNGVADFLDLDGDGIQQEGEPDEPITESAIDGSTRLDIGPEFDLDGSGLIEPHEGRLVAVGGTEIATGLPLPGRLTAAAGHFTLTPLTTLAEELVRRHGFSLQDAESRVEEALALANVNLGTLNPQYATLAGDADAAAVFTAHQLVSDTVVQVASLFSALPGAPPFEFFSQLVFADLADKIAAAGSALDLSEPVVIENVIHGITFATGFVLNGPLVIGAAQVIAAGNRAIADIPVTTDRAYLEAVTRVKQVAQGAAASALADAAAGNIDIATVATEFTGANLDARIAAASIGNVVPPAIAINSLGLFEGEFGQQVAEFEVMLVGESVVPVSVDFATLDSSATVADGDYEAAAGTLYWAAGDNSSRTIQVTVNGDGIFETDEAFLVALSNATNGAIRWSLGYGWIINDDALVHHTPADGPNDLVLTIDGENAALVQNGEPVFSGPFATPVPITIVGADVVDNTLTIDVANPGPLTLGGITFIGGDGTDTLTVLDATSTNVVHTLTNSGTFDVDGIAIAYVGVETVDDSVSPNITGAPAFTLEGAPTSLGSELPPSDDPALVTYAWKVIYGGELYDSGTEADFTFLPQEDGDYVVTLTISAAERATSSQVRTIHVSNAAPVVDAGADQQSFEGSTVALTAASFTDAGTLDTHSATVDWGDGSLTEAATVSESTGSGSVSGSHVYADNGTYTVTVMVTDDEGGSASDIFTVTVNNVAPTISAGGDQTIAEGSIVTLAPASFNDVGTLDTHTATIDWGDGSPVEAGLVLETPFGPPGSTSGASGTISGTHVYADNGIYTVTVTVTDDEGAATNDTFTVIVTNVAPTTEAGTDERAVEGSVVALDSATFNDVGTLDTHTATIDWGDGSPIEAGLVSEVPFGPPGSGSGASGTVSGSHVYADNGTYTVIVTVTDDEGASTSDTFQVMVNNVAPMLAVVADQTVEEGAELALTNLGTITDLGYNNPLNPHGPSVESFTYSIDWGDGTTTEVGQATIDLAGSAGTATAASFDGLHIYADNGTYTVTVTVTDDDGGSDTASFHVVVNNVAPTVRLSGASLNLDANGDAVPFSAVRGQTLFIDSFLTDPGFDNASNPNHQPGGSIETFSYSIDWGDGTSAAAGTADIAVTGAPHIPTQGSFGATHVYSGEGTYTVTVTVVDDDSGATTVIETATIAIVAMQTGGDLAVGGTTGADEIRFRPAKPGNGIQVDLNGATLGAFQPTGRLLAFGQAGDDDIQTSGSIALPAWLYGEAGHDRLKGGAGHDVLIGGDGDDLLVGGSGRDLLIGGRGADRIVGNGDDDILIAGVTLFDVYTADHSTALSSIMKEWTRDDIVYHERIGHLTNGGGFNGSARLNHDTVFDDYDADILTGSAGEDWFFFDSQKDRATDLRDEVFATDLDFIGSE